MFVLGAGGEEKQLIYIIYRKMVLINVIIFHSIGIVLFVAFNITS